MLKKLSLVDKHFEFEVSILHDSDHCHVALFNTADTEDEYRQGTEVVVGKEDLEAIIDHLTNALKSFN